MFCVWTPRSGMSRFRSHGETGIIVARRNIDGSYTHDTSIPGGPGSFDPADIAGAYEVSSEDGPAVEPGAPSGEEASEGIPSTPPTGSGGAAGSAQ